MTNPMPTPSLVDTIVQAFREASGRYRVEGTTDSEFGEPPYRAPWFLIDQSTAEPEVNWPGELIEKYNEPQAAYDHRDRLIAQAALKAHAEWLESRAIEMNITGARALRDSFGWPNQTERAKHCFEAMISVANDTAEIHDSDCAVHNAPAFPAGPCDCGAEEQS